MRERIKERLEFAVSKVMIGKKKTCFKSEKEEELAILKSKEISLNDERNN